MHTRGPKLNRRALVATALGAALACAGVEPDDRPNIIVFISDDQAAHSLGSAGHPWLETPNLDALARDGVRFTNSFVTSSICSPARASFLTGQYARVHGITDNITPLPDDTVTFGSLLTAAGYDTAYIGKWHMDAQVGKRAGFGFSASYKGQGVYRDAPFYIDDELRPTSGHVDQVSTNFAIDFLQRSRDDPFLLVLGFKGAHSPRRPTREFETAYVGEAIPWPPNRHARSPFPTRQEHVALARAARADPEHFATPDDWKTDFDRAALDVPEARLEETYRQYSRSVSSIDAEVGRVLGELEALGRDQDTIVVFVSDNGMHLQAHHMASKRSAYEESMRVVTIFRHPQLPARPPIEEMILNIDLAPTLLDFAGVEVPATMQGRSWRDLVEGKPTQWRDAFVYEYYKTRAFPSLPSVFALRTRDAKLVHYAGYPTWREFFDLDEDPFETRNLALDPARAAEIPDLEKRMAELERVIGERLTR